MSIRLCGYPSRNNKRWTNRSEKNSSPTKTPEARDGKQRQRRWNRYHVNCGENVNEQRKRNNWEEGIAIPMYDTIVDLYLWKEVRKLDVCNYHYRSILDRQIFRSPTRTPPLFFEGWKGKKKVNFHGLNLIPYQFFSSVSFWFARLWEEVNNECVVSPPFLLLFFFLDLCLITLMWFNFLSLLVKHEEWTQEYEVKSYVLSFFQAPPVTRGRKRNR